MPAMMEAPEAAAQTFQQGVPVVLNGGFVQEAAFAGAEIVYGVSVEPGHNLTVAGTAQESSEGNPPNQASAVITPVGSWIKSGKLRIYKANGQSVFSIKLKADQVFSDAMVGQAYGLAKDVASGYWYLDNTDQVGDNVVATVIGRDERFANVAGTVQVLFTFVRTLRFWD